MTIPSWVYSAIFYQIFPDRFANGDLSNDPPNVQPWEDKPTLWGYQGGDLRGVIEHFDYFLELGVNALYFNPIFLATSNHRYNISDYYRIDPLLGTDQDLDELIHLVHDHDMHIILDGVFNHCGRGFFAFNDLVENGNHSPYKDWFHVRRFPIRAYGEGRAEDYEAWWGFRSLPKFNTDNPHVRQYILDVARYWINRGVDGWRLDVPNEIDDDGFWAQFRRAVKDANPDAYLVGEIWEVDPRWVGDNHFDGLMNYPLRDALIAFLVRREMKAGVFLQRMATLCDAYPAPHSFGHMLCLGSHDTRRLRTICNDDPNLVRMFFLIQFCFPGAPHIYYGDEIGLRGEKDPDCRRAFPWDKKEWQAEQRDFVRKLIALRRAHPELQRGAFLPILARDAQEVLAFARVLEDQAALIVLNCAAESQTIDIQVQGLGWKDGWQIQDALYRKEWVVAGGHLSMRLPPRSGVILLQR